MLGQEQQELFKFSLKLVVRDKNGTPTGTKELDTDSPDELSQFWMKHQPRKKRKIPNGLKAKKSSQGHNAMLPKAVEAEAILRSMFPELDEVV
jgi:hypothetical protein